MRRDSHFMIMTPAAPRISLRRPPPPTPSLHLLLLLFIVLISRIELASPSKLPHPPLSSLLAFMFPPSPPPPSHIRILYIGSCSRVLSASIPLSLAYLMPNVAIHCLQDGDPQIGACNWFIHSDDREAGKSSAVEMLQQDEPCYRLHPPK
jgi:hypothetical protein